MRKGRLESVAFEIMDGHSFCQDPMEIVDEARKAPT
jgi:hypothetical protein